MQKVIAGVVVLAAIGGFTMIGCRTTDERIHGSWQADVAIEMAWMNGPGAPDMNSMPPAQRAEMEKRRERMRNRKIAYEFKDDGTWSSDFVADAGQTDMPGGPGITRSGTYSIQDKAEETVTIVLHEDRTFDRILKVRFTETGKFKVEEFKDDGLQEMKFGDFEKQ
jgi:hypothetical protein